jgi:hypothetical protein
MTSIEQLVESIDKRLDELRAEVDRLQAARRQLVSDGAVALRVTTDPDPSKPRRRVRRRAPTRRAGVPTAATLQRLLAESDDGLSTAVVAQLANSDPAMVLPVRREMETSGRVRRTGQRRGTRWHAVASQEEWIRRRAAELAARSQS